MSLWEIISSGSGCLILVLTILQLAPIKINPWSWISKKIGRALNGEVIDKIDKQGSEISKLKETCDEREANDCRYRILRFDDEIRHKKKHTKEHFDQILCDITTYERYCDSHKHYSNNVAIFAIKNIKDTYVYCVENQSFL